MGESDSLLRYVFPPQDDMLLCIGCVTFCALFAGGTIAVIVPFRSLPRNSAPWLSHSQDEAPAQGRLRDWGLPEQTFYFGVDRDNATIKLGNP